ncbi:hypothetical protein GGI24_006794, partial [Coemansia furcata]
MPVAPSLVDILRADATDDILGDAFGADQNPAAAADDDETTAAAGEDEVVPDGACVECKDQQAQLYCEQCQEDFCE